MAPLESVLAVLCNYFPTRMLHSATGMGDGDAQLMDISLYDMLIAADDEFIRESERADMGGVGEGAGVERTEPASLQPLLPCVAR